jgi:hypothetical protein
MKSILLLLVPMAAFGANPALTIYNQNFAVVRERIPLQLQAGVNEVNVAEITANLEPRSMILRDPSGKTELRILEQDFRNDPVNQQRMLSAFEGKEIDFLVIEPHKPDRLVKGRVVRSGDTLDIPGPRRRYGEAAYQSQATAVAEPIIEVDGKLQFRLPGVPVFPALTDQTILKPELSWKLHSSQTGQFEVELCYITGGMRWEADYNLVAREDDGVLDLNGWMSIHNRSGRSFENASVKLLAGDISKIKDEERAEFAVARAAEADGASRPVTEKSFDEYHLYTLEQPLTLRNLEMKQVEFVRATGIRSEKHYIYEGMGESTWRGHDANTLRQDESLGLESSSKVRTMLEFKNSEENGLGISLPKGRMRFYRRDEDGQLEFVGENDIDHTPPDETVRVSLGNAFDMVGERKRTSFEVDSSNKWLEEAFEIILRNRKQESVEIRVVEHLFRGSNWEIRKNSDPFNKIDAQKIEFRVKLAPKEEKKVSYLVHYSW